MIHARILPVLLLSLVLPACAQKSGFKGSAKTGALESKVETTPKPSPTPIAKAPATVSKAPRLVEESYVQSGNAGLADILIVMDDSGSMKSYQKNLSTKLSALLVALKDTDWQIAVITTTVKNVAGGPDICNLKLIKSTDSDAEAKFTDAVNAGILGSGSEQGVRQAKTGLSCAENKWIRDNSTVAVLFVTDEEDASYEPEWLEAKKIDKNAVQADAMAPLVAYVEKDLARTVGVNAAFYGIFSPPSNPCQVTNSTVGKKYQPLFDYKNSGNMNYGRVCEDSYKPTLELISQSIAKLVINFHKLNEVPDIGSLSVSGLKADGSAISASDYKVLGAVLLFNKGSEPQLASTVKLSYKVSE